jgi:hypothetical protein
MIHVTFRFYAQLNDFLPARHRHRRFAHVIPAPASVKDAIEALGVPHPEVLERFDLVNQMEPCSRCLRMQHAGRSRRR